MKVLVTGGAGFIGSHVVDLLLARGCAVRVLDDFRTGRRANLPGSIDSIELIEAAAEDPSAAARAVAGVDAVAHLAGIVSAPRTVREPIASHHANLTATLQLLESARAAGVRRFVFSSSCAVYGDDPSPVQREDAAPRPTTHYGAQKRACEDYLAVHRRLFGMECAALRFFNVYGPRQDPASEYSAVIPKFIRRMLDGQAPVVHGDGLQSRDFVFVGDVAEAVAAALGAEGLDDLPINIGTGRARTLVELAAELDAVAGPAPAPVHTDAVPGDVRRSVACVERAKALLGWSPKTAFRDGLRAVVDSMR